MTQCFRNVIDKYKAENEKHKIPQKVLETIYKDLQKIKEEIVRNGKSKIKFSQRAREFFNYKRELTDQEIHEKGTILLKKKANTTHILQPGAKGNEYEAAVGITSKTNIAINSAKETVENIIQGRSKDYQDQIFEPLFQADLHKQFSSTLYDLDMELEVNSFRKTGKYGITKKPEAATMAKVIVDYQDRIYAENRASGVPLPKSRDYFIPQIDDPQKLLIDNNYPKSLAAWKKEIYKMGFDEERVFKGIFDIDPKDSTTLAAREAILDKIFEKKIKGMAETQTFVGMSEISDVLKGEGFKKPLIDKMVGAKLIHFTTPEGSAAYRAKYGRYNVADTMYFQAKRDAINLSLYDKFGGGDTKASYKESIKDAIKVIEAQAKAGDKTALDRADKLAKGMGVLMTTYDSVAHVSDPYSSATQGWIAAEIRAGINNSKLFFTSMRSMSGIGNAAREISNQTGENFLKVGWNLMGNWVKAVPSAFREMQAKSYSNYLSDMNSSMILSLDQSGMHSPGPLGKSNRLMMKMNDFINIATETANTKMIRRGLAELTSKSFKDLDPTSKTGWLASGFKPEEFVLTSKIVQTVGKDKFFAPDGVHQLTKEDVLPIMQAIGFKGKPEKYLRDFELKLKANEIFANKLATTTAGAREYAALSFGTHPGTLWGDTIRFVTMWKSFWLQSNNIDRWILNQKPDLDLANQGILRTKNITESSFAKRMQGKDIGGWTSAFIMGTAGAYVANQGIRALNNFGGQAVDLVTGEDNTKSFELEDPTDINVIIAAMGRSGNGAFYADLVNSAFFRRDFQTSLMGPVIGQLSSREPGGGMQILGDALYGEFSGGEWDPKQREYITGAIPGLAKLVSRNLPFNQVPGFHQGLDWIIANQIEARLNPEAFEKRQVNKELREIEAETEKL